MKSGFAALQKKWYFRGLKGVKSVIWDEISHSGVNDESNYSIHLRVLMVNEDGNCT